MPYILVSRIREREKEGGEEQGVDGTMDGTHRVKRIYIEKVLEGYINKRLKPLVCQKTCHTMVDESMMV